MFSRHGAHRTKAPRFSAETRPLSSVVVKNQKMSELRHQVLELETPARDQRWQNSQHLQLTHTLVKDFFFFSTFELSELYFNGY